MQPRPWVCKASALLAPGVLETQPRDVAQAGSELTRSPELPLNSQFCLRVWFYRHVPPREAYKLSLKLGL